MIITDCSACSNVQCLNQVSNAQHQIYACTRTFCLSTKYTCCSSCIISTAPITIPSNYAQYSNINVVVESMINRCTNNLNIYTNVECPNCMTQCPHWNLNTYFKDNCTEYYGALGCCNHVISLGKVPSSYAGSCIYIGTAGFCSCAVSCTVLVNFIPEV